MLSVPQFINFFAEQLRRKDEEVRQALADKSSLVADLLSIPREDFQHIADMASEDMSSDISSERDSSEYVLAPLYQGKKCPFFTL